MPRFYFDMVARRQSLEDPEGYELPDTDDARSQAIRTLTEAAQSAPDDGEPHRYSITVRGDGKDAVYEATVTATYRWEKQPPSA